MLCVRTQLLINILLPGPATHSLPSSTASHPLRCALPWPGHSIPHCLLTVYRCTRTHSPLPPPCPGHSFPQLSADSVPVHLSTLHTRRILLPALDTQGHSCLLSEPSSQLCRAGMGTPECVTGPAGVARVPSPGARSSAGASLSRRASPSCETREGCGRMVQYFVPRGVMREWRREGGLMGASRASGVLAVVAVRG